jgi:hypothetical protein
MEAPRTVNLNNSFSRFLCRMSTNQSYSIQGTQECEVIASDVVHTAVIQRDALNFGGCKNTSNFFSFAHRLAENIFLGIVISFIFGVTKN